MAETIRLTVKCHACGFEMKGAARYGSGHYVPEGITFEFTATGKIKSDKGVRVKGEVTCVCPKCTVRNKYQI